MKFSRSHWVVAALAVVGLTGAVDAHQSPRVQPAGQQSGPNRPPGPRPQGPPQSLPWGGPAFAWWRDPQFQRELRLTTEQSDKIESVFRGARPQLQQKFDELNTQENELSRLVENEAQEPAILTQAQRVEHARGDLNTTRTLMIWHIRQVLTPEQRTRMKTLREDWEREHPQGPARNGPPPPRRQ